MTYCHNHSIGCRLKLLNLLTLRLRCTILACGLHALQTQARRPAVRPREDRKRGTHMGPTTKLKGKVEALQLSTEGLFKLLGSNDPEKKLDFWEKLKGITSRADLLLVEHELTVANTL